MPKARIIFHPILINKRSRIIFYWYLALSVLVGAYCWIKLNSILSSAEIYTPTFEADIHWTLAALMSWTTRVALILVAAVLAGAIAAPSVVGPVKRIEDWLADWEQGHSPSLFKLREGDKFSDLINLINQLYNKDKNK